MGRCTNGDMDPGRIPGSNAKATEGAEESGDYSVVGEEERSRNCSPSNEIPFDTANRIADTTSSFHRTPPHSQLRAEALASYIRQ